MPGPAGAALNTGLSVVNGAIEGKSAKEIMMSAAMNGIGYTLLFLFPKKLILIPYIYIFFHLEQWAVLLERLAAH